MENWRNIEGHVNYQVSSIGNVRRRKGKTIYKDGRIAEFSQTILKQSKDRKEYFRVYLSTDSKKQTIRVHKLVAIAFLNHVPCGMDLVVDHIDQDKTNNSATNLQILSNRENCSKGKANKSSIYTGVSFDKSRKKWSAEIRIGKNRKKLGRFVNEIDAHNAYQNELNAI